MLKHKKCLVTGGAGFIGSHLVERLLNEDCLVTVIDNLTEGTWASLPEHHNLTKHKASILNNVSRYTRGQDIIFHLAGIPWPQKSVAKPWETHRVNVDGTLNLLLSAREQKVKKFVFSSTYMVHPKPFTPYALQKLMAEKYCQLFSELWEMETISLRYFNVYGSRMRAHGIYANILSKFIAMISHNKSPIINGDGKQTRDFIHVDDVVNANLIAAESNFSGKVFSVGTGKTISINKVVDILNKEMGKNIRPIHRHSVVEPKKAPIKAGSDWLPGWKPKIKLEDGIKTILPKVK